MQFYREVTTDRWKHMAQDLARLNDHLVEMKEMVKNHAVVSEQKALERHTEMMARLGMVLTALEKATPQYGISPMMQTMSTASQPKEGDIAIPAPGKLKRRTKILHKRMMECLPDSHQEPIHYTVLAHKLLCAPGRLNAQLVRLKTCGLVECMGRGLYRKAAQYTQDVEGK